MSDAAATHHHGSAPKRGRPDFSDLAVSPLEHFKVCWFGVVLRVLQCVEETLGPGAAPKEFPFVRDYIVQLDRRGVSISDPDASREFWAAVEEWERGATCHLPLRAVRLGTEYGWHAVGALLSAGLHDEDPRFGAIFSTLQGGLITAPTVGFLNACWSDGPRGPVRQLQDWGFLNVSPRNDGGRHAWSVQVPAWVWDVITGDPARLVGPGFVFEPAKLGAFEVDDRVYSEQVRAALRALPGLVRASAVSTVVIRGPRSSGRQGVVQSLASALGCGVVTLSPPPAPGDARWALVGPLAMLLGALPTLELELQPGETVHVPPLGGLQLPLALVLGRRGGVAGPGAERAVTVELDMPSVDRRLEMWRRILPDVGEPLRKRLAERYRLPLGRLQELGQQAAARARLAARSEPLFEDFEASVRVTQTEALGSLATPLARGGSWEELAVSDEARSELRAVESRCRHRERLALENHCFAPNAGVRVLLSGPSGTGKTLAVRVICGELGRDVFRIELAAVVNKYIGETEKNLEHVLSVAEELDAALLFDEGDALLSRRTAVQSSNDRYANLETNFLLQRLESFEGIVFITTNASDRVDSAFQRRMDAVVELQLPEMDERRRLWRLHLPHENSVGNGLIDRVAVQCSLTGGQIRNATVHARLLAMEEGGTVNDHLLVTSVRREYRKLGTTCPLRLP